MDMDNKTLQTRYAEHTGKVSDKWSIYLHIYQRLFADYVDRPIAILEIGIQNGGSLEVWSHHFPLAYCFVGCDIDPACAQLTYEDPRVRIVVGDANQNETETTIAAINASFDIVIDDGSHLSRDIVQSFCRYFPRIPLGGIFIAEDLHCSYWVEFGGGLFDPYSSIAFFKRLSDITNHEHWGIPGSRATLLKSFFEHYECAISESELACIHSVEFINSVCVVRKASPASNELGRRIFSGSIDLVSDERPTFPEAKAATPNQRSNQWSQIENPPERQLERANAQVVGLTAELEDKRRCLAEAVRLSEEAKDAATRGEIEQAKLHQDIFVLSTRISAMEQSRSWRLTRPLRYLRRLFA